MGGLYAVGDIHGHVDQLVGLLFQVGLVDADGAWSGRESTLCMTGDLVDRGPDGVGAIELVMRLQSEALKAGGQVACVAGNHDLIMLLAQRFPKQKNRQGTSYYKIWQRNGGRETDLELLTDTHIEWLRRLPVMLLVRDRLLIHADSLLYHRYGRSIDEVNTRIGDIIARDDLDGWDILMDEFATREAFIQRPGGVRVARSFLERYGGTQILHGHTPISAVTGRQPAEVNEPLIYADGLVVNLDGGMYLGAPGFIHRLE
ncbi:MAG: serine/threonine protein phosphatase [Anaerolineae bacterium]|nr:serine/threonine protein phosphatase [Anaerolineae bacterium]